MLGCADLNSTYFTQLRKVVDMTELLFRVEGEQMLMGTDEKNKTDESTPSSKDKLVKRQTNQEDTYVAQAQTLFSDAVGTPGSSSSNQNAIRPNTFQIQTTNSNQQQQSPLFGILNFLTPFLNAVSQPQSNFPVQNSLQRQSQADAVSNPTDRNPTPTLLTMLLDFLGFLGRLWPQFRDFKFNIFSFLTQFRSIITPQGGQRSLGFRTAATSAPQESIFRETPISNAILSSSIGNTQKSNQLGINSNFKSNNNGLFSFQPFPLPSFYNNNRERKRLFARDLMDNGDAKQVTNSVPAENKVNNIIPPVTEEITGSSRIKRFAEKSEQRFFYFS